MSFVIQPPTDQDELHMPGDDLDQLLRSYFQGEMPSSWPICPMPVDALRLHRVPPLDENAPETSRGGLMSSRYALAASVALLLGGSLFLADSFKEPSPSSQGALDSAQRDSLIREKHIQTPHGTAIRVEVQDPDLIDWPMK